MGARSTFAKVAGLGAGAVTYGVADVVMAGDPWRVPMLFLLCPLGYLGTRDLIARRLGVPAEPESKEADR